MTQENKPDAVGEIKKESIREYVKNNPLLYTPEFDNLDEVSEEVGDRRQLQSILNIAIILTAEKIKEEIDNNLRQLDRNYTKVGIWRSDLAKIFAKFGVSEKDALNTNHKVGSEVLKDISPSESTSGQGSGATMSAEAVPNPGVEE